jgi:histidinol dehydrogenase
VEFIRSIFVTDGKTEAAKLRNSSGAISDSSIENIKSIMDDVKRYGDSAIIEYTKKLDGVQLKTLKVTTEEIKHAYTQVSKGQIRSIAIMKKDLAKSERVLLSRLNGMVVSSNGIRLRRSVLPIPSVGCYIPGGKAHYPSTVVMCAVPAKIAGVKRIVAISPPMKNGNIDPLTLVAADICGIDEFYKVGGAQGIAALTNGTQSIPKVSKIIGPGGIFVTIAKILASSRVSIDMVAGPTELIIYADSSANPVLIARDLISQAEHSFDTLCGLVTISSKLANEVSTKIQSIIDNDNIGRRDIVKRSLESNGFSAICNSESTAIEFINEVAPEHLQLMTRNARTAAKRITSAGLVLIGKYAPSSASDYSFGSNHVLPTLGFAKSRASLSVLDFVKIVNTVEASKSGLANAEAVIKEIALAEGLVNHYQAVKERMKE